MHNIKKAQEKEVEEEARQMKPLESLLSYLLPTLSLVVAWWCLHCRRLRRSRARIIDTLDDERDMHAILTHTSHVEFPFLTRTSLEYGLLRTYAIPSISSILARSGQFKLNPGKRYDDTDLLIQEFLLHHVDSERGSTAIRRLNYLHGLYPTIPNPDFLYVLCVFILYPIDWSSLYGYREWTLKEKSAYFRAWHDIGMRMGIREIPESLAAAAEYMESFEAQHMVYADSNPKISEPTIKLFLEDVPSWLRPLGRRLVYAVMDDRLRVAVGYPKQPRWLSWGLKMGLKSFHGVFTRWFLPPRPLEKAKVRITPLGCPVAGGGNESGRQISVRFARFRATPCVYAEKGYRIEELGPIHPGKLAPTQQQQQQQQQLGEEERKLLCPMERCSNVPWPDSLLKNAHKPHVFRS